jgi:hypothetical protein
MLERWWRRRPTVTCLVVVILLRCAERVTGFQCMVNRRMESNLCCRNKSWRPRSCRTLSRELCSSVSPVDVETQLAWNLISAYCGVPDPHSGAKFTVLGKGISSGSSRGPCQAQNDQQRTRPSDLRSTARPSTTRFLPARARLGKGTFVARNFVFLKKNVQCRPEYNGSRAIRGLKSEQALSGSHRRGDAQALTGAPGSHKMRLEPRTIQTTPLSPLSTTLGLSSTLLE